MVQRKTAGAAVLHRVTSWTSAFSGQRGQLICCSQPTKEDRCESSSSCSLTGTREKSAATTSQAVVAQRVRPCERVLPPPRGRDLNIGLRCASRHASVDDTCESTSGGVRRDYEVLDGVGESGCWPEQVIATFFCMWSPKHVTSQKPIVLLPLFMRWWVWLRSTAS